MEGGVPRPEIADVDHSGEEEAPGDSKGSQLHPQKSVHPDF